MEGGHLLDAKGFPDYSLSMGLFPFLRRARRRRLLENFGIPQKLWDWVLREHRIFARLDEADLRLLREYSTILLGEKRFDPVGGVSLDEELKLSISAQAALPLLGLPDGPDWYDDWSTFIVTPREYDVTAREFDESGVVHEYEDSLAGEVFDLGPVALSKADVEASGWGEGYNVVIHEMAHKLDGRNGSIDGVPPLHDDMDESAWREAFTSAYEDLRIRIGARPRRGSRRGRRIRAARIDPYAAEAPEEFFAVACEYFFERPALLCSEYPEVYAQLRLFFRRDPAATGPARGEQ